jgi:hypothetical protein
LALGICQKIIDYNTVSEYVGDKERQGDTLILLMLKISSNLLALLETLGDSTCDRMTLIYHLLNNVIEIITKRYFQ